MAGWPLENAAVGCSRPLRGRGAAERIATAAHGKLRHRAGHRGHRPRLQLQDRGDRGIYFLGEIIGLMSAGEIDNA